jgi:hypothetical protein
MLRKLAASRALLQEALPHVTVPELREAIATVLVTGDWEYRNCSSLMYDTVQCHTPTCPVSIHAEMVMYYTMRLISEKNPFEASRVAKHLTVVCKQLKPHIKTLNEQNIQPPLCPSEGL